MKYSEADLKRIMVAAVRQGDQEKAEAAARLLQRVGAGEPVETPMSLTTNSGSLGDRVREAVAPPLAALGTGATLGLNDEIAGGIGALGAMMPGGRSPGEAYVEDRDAIRRRRDQFREERPIAAVGTEMVGGMGTGGIGAGAVIGSGLRAPANSAVANTARVLGAGAGAGAAAGFGEADTMGAVPNEMVKGAMAGLAGGSLSPITTVASTAAGRALGGLWKAASEGSDQKAQRVLRDILRRTGRDPSDFAETITRLGPDAIVADLDDSTKQALRAIAAIDPEHVRGIRAQVTDRHQDAYKRLMGDAQRTTGAGTQNYGAALRQLDADRSAAAREQYGPIYDSILPVNDALEELMQRPSIAAGYTKALRRGRDAGDPMTMEMGPDGKLKAAPTLRQLDQVKQGIDDVISDNTDPVTGKLNSDARSALGAKRALIEYIEQADPEIGAGYRAARETYAGRTALENAMKYGRRIFRDDADDLEQVVGGYTASEREAFKLGALKSVQDELKRPTKSGNPSNRAKFASPLFQERLRVAFDSDKEFGDFMQSLERESEFGDTYRKLTGAGESDTARIQEDINRMQTDLDIVPDDLSAAGMLSRAVGGAKRLSGIGEGQADAKLRAMASGLGQPLSAAPGMLGPVVTPRPPPTPPRVPFDPAGAATGFNLFGLSPFFSDDYDPAAGW